MINEQAALRLYPAEVHVDAEAVRSVVAASNRVLIVLDDDPTGTQSVSDLPVLTAWQADDFRWALTQNAPAIYVLTNSRSLDPQSAANINREVVQNATVVAAELDVTIGFVSRGDSTLRGHYPLETDVIEQTMLAETGFSFDGVVIVPAFPDAGRITIGGVHYMRGADGLVPIADTEFARDATFGYHSSDLAEWVQEKTTGRWSSNQVVKLDLTAIRGSNDALTELLLSATNGVPIVVDVVIEDDMRLLALALERAEAAGKTFLYRVGPPFVRARIGQEIHPPLTADDVYEPGDHNPSGGLIMVGSHVGLTSRQLAALSAGGKLARELEINIEAVLDPNRTDEHLESVITSAIDGLDSGDVAIHTSRLLRKTDDPEESLEISRRVSAAVVTVVRGVVAGRRPRFVIAKGGITSSDVASKGLDIRRAIVRGPMLPGIVSLWEPVDGPAKGIPYVVFAGNVGSDDSLADVVDVLSSPVSSVSA